MTKFNAYLDTKTNTLTVHPQGSARTLATIPGIRTIGAARGALKRRGWQVTEQGAYPYGITFDGEQIG